MGIKTEEMQLATEIARMINRKEAIQAGTINQIEAFKAQFPIETIWYRNEDEVSFFKITVELMG